MAPHDKPEVTRVPWTNAQETYAALLCAAPGHDVYLHSLHLDEAAAEAQIEKSDTAPLARRCQWTIEIRHADEIRTLMAALDTRAFS